MRPLSSTYRGLIHGKGLSGIVGGIDGNSSDSGDLKAAGINSITGSNQNPNVTAQGALNAFSKTEWQRQESWWINKYQSVRRQDDSFILFLIKPLLPFTTSAALEYEFN